MSWHADTDLFDRYARGQVDAATAASLESHLVACAHCRARTSRMVEAEPLERIWTEVRADVERPQLALLERLLSAAGLPEHTARLVAVTPALRAPWLLAVAVALGFAVLAAHAGGGGPLAFLLLAPLVPVGGVALAYRNSADPAYEIALASPGGGFRLVMLRAGAVALASIAIVGVATVLLPDVGWTAVGWLLPCLALSMLTLAGSTASASPVTVASVLAGAWVLGVLVAERVAEQQYLAFGAGAQVLFGALAVGAAVVLVLRRDRSELRTRI